MKLNGIEHPWYGEGVSCQIYPARHTHTQTHTPRRTGSLFFISGVQKAAFLFAFSALVDKIAAGVGISAVNAILCALGLAGEALTGLLQLQR